MPKVGGGSKGGTIMNAHAPLPHDNCIGGDAVNGAADSHLLVLGHEAPSNKWMQRNPLGAGEVKT